MKEIRNTLLIILCLAAIISCSKKSLVGFYTTNPENKAAFAGKELTLNTDGTFEMNSWTDSFTISIDENGEQECNETKSLGHGSYTAEKGQLHLKFENIDFLTATINVTEKSDVDSSWFDIKIDLVDEKGKPYSSPRLHVLDKKGNIIRNIFCHGEPPFDVHVRKDTGARALSISMFGSKDFIFEFARHGDGEHRFEINRCRGYYTKGTELSLDYKLTKKGIEYTNEQGHRIELTRGIALK